MDINTLVTQEVAADTNGAKLSISVAHSMDGTYAEITVFDSDASYITDATISDAELSALKSDLSSAIFF